MSQTDTDLRARAFGMFREMVANFPAEPSIDAFRGAYDDLFTQFEVDPDATIAEVDADGVRCLRLTLASVPSERDVVFFHGGGYMCGNPEGVVGAAARVARAARATVLLPDYRLAPEHPHPAAHDDGVAAIRWLIANGAPASRIGVVGESAGGGLALSTVVSLRETGQVPAAIATWSPMVDLEVTGVSVTTFADRDPLASEHSLKMSADAYLQGQDPRSPTANVLADDLRDFPPLLIQAGGEALLDDSLRLARQAALAGVDVSLEVIAGLPHIYPYFADFLPEAQRAIDQVGAFLRDRIPV